MKKIISASYKNDIPAFFAEKFFEDLKKGFTTDERGNIVSLKPEDVSCIVFWTKNCSDYFRANLTELDKTQIPYYFQWTISGYGKDIEPMVPDKLQVIANFKEVSNHVGKERTIVRYDPIFISKKYSIEYHCRAFALGGFFFHSEVLAEYKLTVNISRGQRGRKYPPSSFLFFYEPEK